VANQLGIAESIEVRLSSPTYLGSLQNLPPNGPGATETRLI